MKKVPRKLTCTKGKTLEVSTSSLWLIPANCEKHYISITIKEKTESQSLNWKKGHKEHVIIAIDSSMLPLLNTHTGKAPRSSASYRRKKRKDI